MPFVHSRVNGLKIAIPNDAAGVIHRFAIGGGGNELVFEPVKRNDFEKSRASEAKPVELAASGPEEAPQQDEVVHADAVTLTLNIADEGDTPVPAPAAAPAAKPRRGSSRKATPSTDDDVTI